MSKPAERPIPTGLWKLNPARSQMLIPKTMTLWIIENTTDMLRWVAVETPAGRDMAILSWQGRYGGEPSEVVGAGIKARLTSAAAEGIRTEGEFPGLGPFVEFCRLSDDRRHMVCDGEVTTPQGIRRYHEEFDWCCDSPHGP